MALWRISLLGSLRWERLNPAGEITEAAAGTTRGRQSRQMRALLGYMALFSRAHRRDELITQLGWEEDSDGGRNRLRVELSTLKKTLEPPDIPPGSVLEATRDIARLHSPAILTDVSRFESLLNDFHRHASLPALRAALDLYLAGGELLTDLEFPGLIAERERLAALFESGLHTAVAQCERAGDGFSALRYALAATRTNPEDEEMRETALRLALAGAGSRPIQDEMSHLREAFHDDLPRELVALEDSLHSSGRGVGKLRRPTRKTAPVTLREAVESRLLRLPPADRTAARQLTVFAGSFLAEAAAFVLRRPDAEGLLQRLKAVGLLTEDAERFTMTALAREVLLITHNRRDRDRRQCRLAVWILRRLRACDAHSWQGEDYDYDTRLKWQRTLVAPEWVNICGLVEESIYVPADGSAEGERRFRFGVRFGLYFMDTALLQGEGLRHAAWMLEGMRHIERLTPTERRDFARTSAFYANLSPPRFTGVTGTAPTGFRVGTVTAEHIQSVVRETKFVRT